MTKTGRQRLFRVKWGWIFALIAVAFVAGFLHSLSPVSHKSHYIRVEIAPDSGTLGIGRTLQNKGLIRSAWSFLLYAKIKGYSRRLEAGAYLLSPSMSTPGIAETIAQGKTDNAVKVTIPEGFTLKQIAQTLYHKGVISDPQAFLKFAHSARTGLTAPFPLPKVGLEGYLYPDTYFFLPNSHYKKVAQVMLNTFVREFYDPYHEDISRSNHNLNQIVTIASLIEREAEVEKDRPLIAGVIENRLRKHMNLDIDASVLYSLGVHKDRVLYKDLKVRSPYNTYLHKGLPPGPIASPGLPSLLAALHPDHNDYYYYVASPDGSHIFTRTFSDHLAAIKRVKLLESTKTGAHLHG